MPVSFSEAGFPFTVHQSGSLLTGAATEKDTKTVHQRFQSVLDQFYWCMNPVTLVIQRLKFQSSHKKNTAAGLQIVWLIYNRWNKCALWQRLMGWSRVGGRRERETTGCREGATENDESGTAARRDGRFLELLRMWSRHGCHPERWVLFMTATGITRSSPDGKRAFWHSGRI